MLVCCGRGGGAEGLRIDRERGCQVTGVQIAAKSILTGMVVYAAISLLRPWAELPFYLKADNTALGLFLLAVCIALLAAAGVYVIAATGRLLPRAVDDEALAPDRQRRFLAQSLTLAMVLLVLGVYLLAGAPHFVRWHLSRTVRFCDENAIERQQVR